MEIQRGKELDEHIRNFRSSAHHHHHQHPQPHNLHTSLPRAVAGPPSSQTSQSASQTSRQNSQNSFLSDVFEASQPDSSESVYFKMDDVINEVGGVDSITMETTDSGNMVEVGEDAPDNHRAMNETEMNVATPVFDSPLTSSHPHTLPTLHRPRLLLCGAPGGGQSSHLGPALLHALEEIPVKVLDLSSVVGVTSCSPEESLVQLFKEAKRVLPCVLYLPHVDSWWGVTTETFQATFTSSLLSLPPATSLVVVATAECTWDDLCPSLKTLFSFVCESNLLV